MLKEVAECVGLWLAEGDSKSERELTFTNNCFDLILFFKETIDKIYDGSNRPRLYIYSTTDRQLFTQLDGFKRVKFYLDKRARRPYYIYRLADTNFMRKWKVIVKESIIDTNNFSEILRGIFAGEGNVKHNLDHNSRSLRISSKNRNELIERILNFYKINFKFDSDRISYLISARYLPKTQEIKLTELHPEKESKFKIMMDSLTEKHYSPGELKRLLLLELNKFNSVKQLSNSLSRSQLRVLEVLQELKRENKVDWVRIKGQTLWMLKENKIKFLKEEKIKILSKISPLNSYTAIGNKLGVDRKFISKRILNYQKANLIEKDGKWWKLTEKGKDMIMGIDESGREITR